MTTKIYGPWIDWNGGECPVPPDTMVEVRFRYGFLLAAYRADSHLWCNDGTDDYIVEYRTVTEQADLDVAEKLLRENGYTIIPPAKPLTFEDVVPMTEAPPMKTKYWVVQPSREDGVLQYLWDSDDYDVAALRHRMAYLEKEHALIAARHIFGLKGGEL